MTRRGMNALALGAILSACGGAGPSFEGTWAGSVTRTFLCENGGGFNSDFAARVAVHQQAEALELRWLAGWACDPVAGQLEKVGGDWASLGAAGCGSSLENYIFNVQSLEGGSVDISSGKLAVTVREFDQGWVVSPWDGRYVCNGTAYGVLARED